MIREGHIDVLKYRSNFFKTAIEELADFYNPKEEAKEKEDTIDDKSNIKWLQGMAI